MLAISGRTPSGQLKLIDRVHTLLLITCGYLFSLLLTHFGNTLDPIFLESALPRDLSPIIPINFSVLIGLSGVIMCSALALDNYHLKFKHYPAALEHRIHRRLDYSDVFDNPNRQKIITSILNEPGIHYNKLKMVCDL